jgi:tetratricopeptide (TPR) repeat protein
MKEASQSPGYLGGPRPQNGAVNRAVAYVLAGLFALYVLAVLGAYSWIHVVRKGDQVGITDVAFFRLSQVRHAMAEQQFVQAKQDWEKKDYRAAYVAYVSALRRDPDNVEGRLEAADFFSSIGSVKLEVTVLQEGLTRSPEDGVIARRTLELLTSTGRDRSALDLIGKLYGNSPRGEIAPTVNIYRILAMMNTGDDAGAKTVLSEHPEVRQCQTSVPALANILWRSGERLAAIRTLSKDLAAEPESFAAYSQLAEWQAAGGMNDDAVTTAKRSRSRFPNEISARILMIEMLSAQMPGSTELKAEIDSFIRDSGGRPEALGALAELAGRKGWIDLDRNLYLVSANRQPDLRIPGLLYSDALAVNNRSEDQQAVLEQVEAQSGHSNAGVAVQLRRREVIAAAALGDRDGVREKARYLSAALLKSDPDSMDAYRRLFEKLGIKDAVAAFPVP